MEIAIPLVALGGMYIISNQPSRNCGPNKKNLKSILNGGSGSGSSYQNQRQQQQPQQQHYQQQPRTENFKNM